MTQDQPAAHLLPAGYQLHEYRITRVLGAGGFGITYLAHDTHLDKPCAVKEYLPKDFALRGEGSTVLPLSEASNADFDWGLERFLEEARVMAQFSHPNLVGVSRFFQANGTAYIVMDYIEGETLTAFLNRGGAADRRRTTRDSRAVARSNVKCSRRRLPAPRHQAGQHSHAWGWQPRAA